MANPYKVVNADGTPTKAEQITEYIQAYVEIGSHKIKTISFYYPVRNKEIDDWIFILV